MCVCACVRVCVCVCVCACVLWGGAGCRGSSLLSEWTRAFLQAEQTKQVWAQCSDVEIVAASSDEEPPPPPAEFQAAAAAAAAGESPSRRPVVCVGESLGLAVDECAGWVQLYDALGGEGWVGHDGASPAAARLDPCGGLEGWWDKTVVCVAERDYKHITEIYLMGAPTGDIKGRLPPSIAALIHLTSERPLSFFWMFALPPSLSLRRSHRCGDGSSVFGGHRSGRPATHRARPPPGAQDGLARPQPASISP